MHSSRRPSIDLTDAYFQIPILPLHRNFLRFAVGERMFQYTHLPFGYSLAPYTFSKCEEATLECSGWREWELRHWLLPRIVYDSGQAVSTRDCFAAAISASHNVLSLPGAILWLSIYYWESTGWGLSCEASFFGGIYKLDGLMFPPFLPLAQANVELLHH